MLKTLSITEQVAEHLREELSRGRWTGFMPGRDSLANELGVNDSTVARALGQLEREGLIKSCGAGKRREIIAQKVAPLSTRVLIVLYEPGDEVDNCITTLKHQLHAAGHHISYAPKSLNELKQDPERVAAMVSKQAADVCILVAAARPVLEKFSKASIPTFALFGQMADLPIAGTGANKLSALRACIHRLFESGRERLVMLSRSERLQSELGANERLLFEELKMRNLPHGNYNLPEWKNTPEGLRKCLSELFKVTPPEAILVDDWMLTFAIEKFLARSRGPAYRRAVCISMDYHPSFKWCQPGIAYFDWDADAVVRRVVQWVNNVAKGKKDTKQRLIEAKFVEGGALAVVDER